ncbi:MAG: replication-associated recombination protein A [Puniceicoccales bacterium]|jgi:putative ATPase|nr:replication-associated recombination protein A [Puniceicoccales bacterium]
MTEFFETCRMGSGPLAVRMRPRNLDEIVGQDALIRSPFIDLVRNQSLGSLILYGPPGSGKTSIAEAIANEEKRRFMKVNAVLSNVTELREILRSAQRNPSSRTILFIDEIHRFNKSQQDLLLPDVEAGTIQLIGATTHNPGFYVINPLLSRCRLIELEPLSNEAIIIILKNALEDKERGLGTMNCTLDADALTLIAEQCNGDSRKALNVLESIVLNTPLGTSVTVEEAGKFLFKQQLVYDADEDEHYNTISAYIKSIRGCDPDAAIYWLAVMLEGGEDPRFIARRLLIIASEDIGLADSRAILVANACFDACERLGMPECRLSLAHTTVFCALAPKSNSTYLALEAATAYIKKHGKEAVPIWLRDAHGAAAKKLQHGKYYQYSHNFERNISGQEYMLTPKKFYEPKAIGAEKVLAERLREWQDLKENQIQKKY